MTTERGRAADRGDPRPRPRPRRALQTVDFRRDDRRRRDPRRLQTPVVAGHAGRDEDRGEVAGGESVQVSGACRSLSPTDCPLRRHRERQRSDPDAAAVAIPSLDGFALLAMTASVRRGSWHPRPLPREAGRTAGSRSNDHGNDRQTARRAQGARQRPAQRLGLDAEPGSGRRRPRPPRRPIDREFLLEIFHLYINDQLFINAFGTEKGA